MTRSKRRVPDWVYYAFAVLLTAATFPMYRYMFLHAGDARGSSVVAVAQPSVYSVADVQPSVSADALVRKPLLPGELCEAGYVVLKHGHSYTQGFDRYGHPSRCEGSYLVLPR